MALFTCNHPVTTLLLLDQGSLSKRIDLFGARIHPRGTATLDDTILALLSVLFLPGPPHQWNRHGGDFWSKNTLDGTIFEHPLASIEPGAIQISAVHGTAPFIPAHLYIKLTDKALLISDTPGMESPQSLPLSTLSAILGAPAYTSRDSHTAARELREAAGSTPLAYGITLGYLDAALQAPTPATTADLALVEDVCARAMPLCAESGARSGRAARQHGAELGRAILHNLYLAWDIRPAPHTEGDHFCTTPQMAQHCADLVENGRGQGLDIGRALHTIVAPHRDVASSALGDAYATTPPPSAHAAMALAKLRKAVDAAIIQGAPAHLLKPGAARRRAA